MTEPRYAQLMTDVLKRVPVDIRQPTDTQDARGILEIERALVTARRRQRAKAFGAVSFAAVAAIAAGWVLFVGQRPLEPSAHANAPELQRVNVVAHASGAGVRLRVAGHEQPMDEDAALVEGTAILSGPSSEATLALSTGTRMKLATSTQFAVEQAGALQRFQLATGSLHAKVAKLGRSQRFVVATPDAEIEVRGTEFDLSVVDQPGEGCEGSRTLLRVSEGVVEVRAAGGMRRIGAGQRWPANCGVDHEATSVEQVGAAVGPSVQEPMRRGVARSAAAQPAVAQPSGALAPERLPEADNAATRSSHLIEQNDLFASGVAARRNGDTQGALAAYGQLLARFPTSPLAENAMVERIHLLEKTNPEQAAAEAQRYLSRFPNGFGRNEASAVLQQNEAKKGER